jgi:hypothetical protein
MIQICFEPWCFPLLNPGKLVGPENSMAIDPLLWMDLGHRWQNFAHSLDLLLKKTRFFRVILGCFPCKLLTWVHLIPRQEISLTHPISDDAKDLVMKLFSATIYDASRHWYLSLLNGSIKTMDRLEEAFLKRWSVKEDPNMLLTRLNNLAKYENESIREFHTRFETLLQRIPTSHHLKDDYLVHVYTRYFNGQLGYLLRD